MEKKRRRLNIKHPTWPLALARIYIYIFAQLDDFEGTVLEIRIFVWDQDKRV